MGFFVGDGASIFWTWSNSTANLAVMLRHLPGEFLVGGQHLTKLYERAHDGDIHLNGPLAAENRGKHCYPVLGKRPKAVFGVRRGQRLISQFVTSKR
jgi:hypothetical protein